MPKPLSHYGPTATLELNVNSVGSEPEMAQLAMNLVVTCSFIEDSLLRFVSEQLIHSDFRVVAEMLADFQSFQRRQLVRKAAGVTLTSSDLEVFGQVMTAVDRAMDERNKFAHQLWCTVVEKRGGARVRGVMALVDTKKMTREHAKIFAEPMGPAKLVTILNGPKPPADVYTVDEIRESLEAARRALHLVWAMMMGVGPDRDLTMHETLRQTLGLPPERPRPSGPAGSNV
jgi:hypothetical protein